jgi:hypothetical protein
MLLGEIMIELSPTLVLMALALLVALAAIVAVLIARSTRRRPPH